MGALPTEFGGKRIPEIPKSEEVIRLVLEWTDAERANST
jgi:hypothetical protein